MSAAPLAQLSSTEWLAQAVDEPWALLEPSGSIRARNDLWSRWFPGQASFDSLQDVFPEIRWGRVERALSRYGVFRHETETTFDGQPRPTPICARLMAHGDTIVVHVRDRAREVEKEHLLRSYAELAERHQESLAEQRQALADVLDAVPSAILSIDAGGVQRGPVSRAAKTLLGSGVVGGSVWESLFRCIDPESPTADSIRTTLRDVFGRGSDAWSLYESSLPTTVEFRDSTRADRRLLRLQYTPVFADEALDRLLVIAEDNSAVAHLQRELLEARQRASFERLAARQMRALHIGLAARFLATSAAQLTALEEALETATEDVAWMQCQQMATRLRDNARAIGATLLASSMGDVLETVCATLQRRGDACRDRALAQVQSARDTLETYREQIDDDASGSADSVEPLVNIEDDMLATLEAVAAGTAPVEALQSTIASLQRLRASGLSEAA